MMDRRLIENFDWSIIWTLLAIICIGLLSIYSALYPQIQARPANNLFIKQIIWLAIGFAVLCASLFINYQRLRTLSPWLYGSVFLLLIVVLVAGKEVHGSKRWLEIAGFQFQPSEFIKVIIVIQLAGYFSSQELTNFPSIKKLIFPMGFVVLPVLLVLAEPDLGTAISLVAIAATMILFVGVRWKYLAVLALTVIPLIVPSVGTRPETLSETPHSHSSSPRSGPPWRRIPYQAIKDCHRFRNALGKRIPQRHSEQTPFPAGKTHGFHFFSLG